MFLVSGALCMCVACPATQNAPDSRSTTGAILAYSFLGGVLSLVTEGLVQSLVK